MVPVMRTYRHHKIHRQNRNQSRRDGTIRARHGSAGSGKDKRVESRRDGIEPLRMKSWGPYRVTVRQAGNEPQPVFAN